MEVHSTESKSSAAGAAAGVADEATAKQKENGTGNVAAAVSTANSSVDDSKVKMAATQTFVATPMILSDSILTKDRLLLLDDSTLDDMPEYCKTIFASIDSQKTQQVDLLMLLIYCIALESSFTLTDRFSEVELEPTYWGSSYHKRNVEKLATIPGDLKGTSENFVLNLTFYPLPGINGISLTGIHSGEFLILTITPGYDEPGRSVCVPISRYVLSSIRSQSIAARFRNLKELAYELKEKIFTPARIQLSELAGCEVYLGLCGMPEDILYLILKRLKLKFIQNLSKTCRKMRCLCENYHSHRTSLSYELITPIPTPSSASSLQLSFLTNILD